MIGESNRPSHKGYGIYPARINIDTAGVVQNWGTPLADSNVSSPADPGAGVGLPSNHMVLEFASLYYDDGIHDTNAPGVTGTLCKFTVNPGAVSNPPIIMKDEITYRGGVVLENGTQDLTAADKTLVYTTAVPPPGKATNPSPANSAVGVNSNTGITTLTWTTDSGATSQNVYLGTVATPVTLVGTGTSYVPTLVEGKTYYWRVDEINAGGTTTGDIWTFNTDCYKSTALSYAAWVTFGKPACWCYQRNCRGDADGIKTGLYWVNAPDLTLLKAGYLKNDTALAGVPNGICADFDHTKTGLYRVNAPDLTLLKAYYLKSQTSVPVCDVANVNFWTN